MAEWKMSKLMHGGDYNPDQWRDQPGILDEDMRLMKLAKCDLMSVGIFAWSALEPEEGVFTFDWLDDVMDRIAANGGRVFLATPSGARPAWMSHKYPEVLRVAENGLRNFHGRRHNHCYTSPVYREKAAIINEKLAQRYASHPALAGWHVSNEYGGECFCPLCQQAFRDYLRAKFGGDIDALNKAWWTDFWSHRYNSFDQIEAPSPRGEVFTDGLTIEWHRFVTLQTADFMRHECVPLRKYTPDTPITANFMGTYPILDYFRFTDIIDVASWDSYPRWRNAKSDITLAADTAFKHDLTRSLLKKPFLLMESTPSTTNGMEVCKLKRPGMHMLSSMHAVAHGSDSVQYFQWRKSRNCSEKHHGAVVDHEGSENSRVFRDVAEVGAALERMENVAGGINAVETALIFDWDNRWALSASRGPRSDKQHDNVAFEHYRALSRCGVGVDVIDSERALDGYKLVVAPMLYMLKPGARQNIRRFVENGGTFVATYLFGQVDENSLCFLGGFPGGGMEQVMGVWAEETDALYDDESNSIVLENGEQHECGFICDVIHARGAKVLGTYGSDYYAGQPALTENSFGKGRAYYIAARTGEGFLTQLYNRLTAQAGVYRPAGNAAPLEEGVDITERTLGDIGTLFVMNFSPNESRHVALPQRAYRELISGGNSCERDSIDLPPLGVAALQYKK